MAMQQDAHFQQYVEAYMEQNKDTCFQNLIKKGAKVPYNFDIEKKIQKHAPTMKEEFKQMKKKMAQMEAPKSSFSLDLVCPNPFDESVDIKYFPRKFLIPQYDKYD